MSAGITAARVAEFLGRGLFDVLVDLFKADPALYALLGELLASPELGVRLGAAALVEELAAVDPARRPLAAAALLPLLGDADPVRRGDAAYLLGFVGGARAARRRGPGRGRARCGGGGRGADPVSGRRTCEVEAVVLLLRPM